MMPYLLLHAYFYRVIITIKAKLQKHKTNKEKTRMYLRAKQRAKNVTTHHKWEWNDCAIKISK